MASRVNPDGTTSFLSIDPGVRGFEFNAPTASGVYTRLTLRDPQHTYEIRVAGWRRSRAGLTEMRTAARLEV